MAFVDTVVGAVHDATAVASAHGAWRWTVFAANARHGCDVEFVAQSSTAE
jgi:hypothetical protein